MQGADNDYVYVNCIAAVRCTSAGIEKTIDCI